MKVVSNSESKHICGGNSWLTIEKSESGGFEVLTLVTSPYLGPPPMMGQKIKNHKAPQKVFWSNGTWADWSQ